MSMSIRFSAETDALFLIDAQDPFMNSIADHEHILKRIEFVVRSARALGVPILATEQVPAKLGPMHPNLDAALEGITIFPKSAFSAMGDPTVASTFSQLSRRQAVLVGVETHICVAQTALDLLAMGCQVAVCPDAVGSSTTERHKLGMERLRDSGVMPIHTEGLVYEWMGSSQNPAFRDILKWVKQFA